MTMLVSNVNMVPLLGFRMNAECLDGACKVVEGTQQHYTRMPHSSLQRESKLLEDFRARRPEEGLLR